MKLLSSLFNIIIISLLLVSCRSTEKRSYPYNANPDKKLTLEMAQMRSQVLSKIKYTILVSLYEKSKIFGGSVDIQFDLSQVVDLPLDFKEGKVKSITINKKPASVDNTLGKIWLPKELLVQGTNTVSIDFDQNYTNIGVGLHKFTDPEDGNEYFYTQFEPYDANRFIPCFDQPDLKAVFNLTVTAPKNWVVISSTLPLETKNDTKVRNRWIFPDSPLMSTYLLSLHAGPFKIWKSSYNNIPLRLFARKSLSQYVNPDFWLKITVQGFRFFEDYFAMPYPFKKYDQILVPEFGSEAMENIAAVTFTEDYIKRGNETRDNKLLVANTLLHEMAHMWFGNLVTMKWWNDLWLNESFATYLSSIALYEATEFKEAWLDFQDSKQWAYFEDQLITTHPIEANVLNTDDAFSNFDGITYGKGAAVLKQLHFYLGEDFKKGIQQYFKKYSYQNTELKDFIGSLEESSKKDLSQWANLWLRQSGVDSLAVTYSCENNELTSVNLTVESLSKIKPQKILLGVLSENKDKLSVTNTIPVAIDGSQKILGKADFGQINCPAMIFPNQGDHAYIKFSINNKDLDVVKTKLGHIEDPLTRMMIWDSLWQMVRDQKLKSKDFLELALNNLNSENEQKILNYIITSAIGGPYNTYNNALYFLPKRTEAEKIASTQLVSNLEAFIFKKIETSKPGSDRQILWYDSFLRLAETKDATDKVYKILTNQSSIPGLKLDIDRKWQSLLILCQANYPSAPKIESDLAKLDNSDRGRLNQLLCQASSPTVDRKKEFFNKITMAESPFSLEDSKSIMSALFPPSQFSLKSDFNDLILNFIKNNLIDKDEDFQSSFANRLHIATCELENNARLKNFLDSNKNLPTLVKKELRVILQEDERCIKITDFGRI